MIVGNFAMKVTRTTGLIHQVIGWMLLGKLLSTTKAASILFKHRLLFGFGCDHEEPASGHVIRGAQFFIPIILGPGHPVIQWDSDPLLHRPFCATLSLGRS